MKNSIKALILAASLTTFNAMAQTDAAAPATKQLSSTQEKDIHAVAANIVKCAMVKAPKGTVSIQTELYPIDEKSAQVTVIAINDKQEKTIVQPCDNSQIAAQMYSIAPYLPAKADEKYVGYLMVNSVDGQTVFARLIPASELEKANAAAQAATPQK